ncbi:hypothetical protein CNMCM8980_009140 [Aspergillus fumigatiaffinis]|uniref:ERT1/acuK family PAS domain-containing protein n=1 Tax=Aspergillus fumigatiaffinis TaxID=340414 RepID=A0A8H4GWM3_9EURO|nr:hypothetical protein CNMCM5878_001219 [Aspergillus fumigatiaffinis]KAF4223036.1 hypothetical protein CNMCM6457_000803 [Aspergillus fumigatiaffinis]KAF4230157.1 hypothetical protein CNMCM6805_000978 [Aspergillus fumigatiaffinis]KAF4246020.1 hypothetical protein CNMCM8980_009140 [Aspergillus fumigatiaffinis]
MDCNNGSCPRHHIPKAGTVPPRWFPSAEEPGKKDGQPARPSVVISAGKSEHEAITIARRHRTPQLAATHDLRCLQVAIGLAPSCSYHQQRHQRAELCATTLRPARSKRSMTENGAAQTGTVPDEQPRNGTMENVKLNMAEGDSSRMESGSKNTASPPVKADNNAAGTHSSPKKRRKVNHGKTLSLLCILRGFWQRPLSAFASSTMLLTTVPTLLQHASTVDDREPSKRARSEHEHSTAEEEGHSNNEFSNVQSMPRNVDVQDAAGQQILPDGTIALPPSSVSAVQHNNIPSSSAQNSIGPSSQQLLGYNDWLGGQSQFQDMHTFHPSYMFNAPEVTNEYNLLGDFLSSSLLDDGGMFPNDNLQGIYSDPTLINSMANLDNTALLQQAQPPQPTQSQPPQNDSVQGPSSTVVNDKARETYYMTAADPSGSDPPEERMNKLLKAKYDAGLLKPFNYVKGYARLNQYMEKNMKQSSRQKILRQLDKFRPKFRERMQSLTDIELILVEMWFERSLMEYDRVFASMAIPACCWRRTGEIFRGNKEMAELIGVPIESLRDGKLAIHEIIVEDQLVSYWEKFGAIAFDNTQKAMLTSCTLKNPNSMNALAFAMLDCAASAHNQGNSRSFELALRAARTCMNQGHLDLSQKIISVAATRLNDMSRNQSSHYRAKVETYMTEYYMLRVYLSWLQGRSDIAEHLFSKVPQASRGGHQETVMDICYQVGAQAISRRQLDVAARWLERALSSCELLQHETQQASPGLKDKRLRVLIAFAWASLHLDTADAECGLERAVVCLESEYDDAFEAQVLQLEILSKENISDYDEYAESKKTNHIPRVCHHSSSLSVLRRAIAALELNDADLKTTSPSEPVLHLLDISLKFTDLYDKKTGTKDRAFMYLLAEYMKSNKLIADARGRTPSSAKAYKKIRQSVQRFETYLQGHLDTCNTIPEREAWMHKHRLLLALDFEAAINLKQWDDIPNIIERASNILDDHLCSVFLDCTLRSGASAPNIAQVVKDIICIFHSSPSPSFDAGAFHQKLPRYLRCLFQIALEAKEYSLAGSVLQQAIVLARDSSADTDLPFLYPTDELKWLAAMAFNRAVDLYLASADEDCRKWGEIAFTLAGLIKDDGGALLRMLRQNYAKLM